jgi:hypothetical protein
MAGDVARFWRDFMTSAPDEVGSALAFITAPPADFVPEPVRGHPILGCVVCYAGDPEEGARVMAPLREFGPPPLDVLGPMPYTAVQDLITEANPHGRRNYWSADFLAGLPDEAIDTLVERATKPVSPFSQMLVIAGGARSPACRKTPPRSVNEPRRSTRTTCRCGNPDDDDRTSRIPVRSSAMSRGRQAQRLSQLHR